MVVPSVGSKVRSVSKLNFAFVAAAILCGTMGLERYQRVRIDAPTPAEMALRIAVAACPDNDNVPYTPRCLAFLGSGDAPSRGGRISLAETPRPAGPLASGSQCPDNDNKPYPPDCVRFLSGWFWRVN